MLERSTSFGHFREAQALCVSQALPVARHTFDPTKTFRNLGQGCGSTFCEMQDPPHQTRR